MWRTSYTESSGWVLIASYVLHFIYVSWNLGNNPLYSSKGKNALMQNDYQKLLQYKKTLIFCQQMIDTLYPSSFWHLHGSGLWRGRQSTLFSGDTEVFQSQPRPFQHVLGLPRGPPPGYMKDLTWETPQSGTRTTLACFSCGPITHRRV